MMYVDKNASVMKIKKNERDVDVTPSYIITVREVLMYNKLPHVSFQITRLLVMTI